MQKYYNLLINLFEFSYYKFKIYFFTKMVRIIENYTLYEIIGEGAYGKVYRSINKNDNK